jgi:hypothetical protein
MTIPEDAIPVRIRHGVHADLLFGFRAMRQINGVQSWIGPWRPTDALAQADVDMAAAALRVATEELGIPLTENANPDIGVWKPNP